MSEGPVKFEKNTVISVFGASGDLAKKKTFPALFGLFREGYLDPSTKIFGYARSKLSMEDLKSRVLPHLKKPHGEADDSKVEQFFKMVSYISGNYDTDEGFDELRTQIEKFEKSANVDVPHRLFYLALPSVFFDGGQADQESCVRREWHHPCNRRETFRPRPGLCQGAAKKPGAPL